MARIVAYIILLTSVFTVTEACKCALVHPQTSFCIADFAIRAKVLGESVENSTRIYKLKILQTFKRAEGIKGNIGTKVKGKESREKRVVRAYTELDSAACGIQLTKTKIYLLLGYIRKRKLSLDSCQWYQLWKETTDPQKRGLKKFYGRNCECRIDKYCLKSPPETCDDMIGGCNVTDSDWRITQCKKQYAFCVKNPDGDECHWVEKKSFKKCLPKKD